MHRWPFKFVTVIYICGLIQLVLAVVIYDVLLTSLGANIVMYVKS